MDADLMVTQAQLAAVFAVSVRTIQRWHAEGLPRTNGATSYRLPDVVRWRLERERERCAAGEIDELDQARVRKETVRAELLEIEVAQKRGTLVEVVKVDRMLWPLMRTARDRMLLLPDRVTDTMPILADPHERHSYLRKEIGVALQDLADQLEKLDAAVCEGCGKPW